MERPGVSARAAIGEAPDIGGAVTGWQGMHSGEYGVPSMEPGQENYRCVQGFWERFRQAVLGGARVRPDYRRGRRGVVRRTEACSRAPSRLWPMVQRSGEAAGGWSVRRVRMSRAGVPRGWRRAMAGDYRRPSSERAAARALRPLVGRLRWSSSMCVVPVAGQ